MQECIQGFKSLSLRQEKRIGCACPFFVRKPNKKGVWETLAFSLTDLSSMVGAVLREKNALRKKREIFEKERAGRAAKGANPFLCAKKNG